jgi:hypothetical protein
LEKLSKEETLFLYNLMYDFYSKVDSIEDYYIVRKKERVKNLTITFKDKLFNEWDINPYDFDISLEIMDESSFDKSVQSITSVPIENQIGRRLNILVKENKTDKWLGFIRVCSPIASIAPRNQLMGYKVSLSEVNQNIYCGSIIVPVQPFGYNYLGGKLMALISTSNEVRDMYNKKYNTDIKLFETTSLYGDLKQSSQYDGLKPYMKRFDKTTSDVLLYPTDEFYFPFRNLLRKYYGEEKWGGSIATNKSGPKQKEFVKGIQILTNHIKLYYPEMVNDMIDLKSKMKIKSKKNYYYSNFGYDLETLINVWKKKSHSRWSKLKTENRLKKDIEIYTTETLNDLKFGIVHR